MSIAGILHRFVALVGLTSLRCLACLLTRCRRLETRFRSVYESKLTEFGIPVEELGFRPLVTATGTGPAGLVVS